MAEVLILLAHPQLQHSRINRAMIEAVAAEPGVVIHDLYERYPDFHISLRAEKQALLHARAIIFQHPMQWYSCPALLKEWIDIVLQKGWAYGEGGTALKGKRWLSAISASGSEDSYSASGFHAYTAEDMLRPFERTAHLCGMKYLKPFIFYNALRADEAGINAHVAAYRARIRKLVGGQGGE